MKLQEIYELAIEKGMEADPRGKEKVKELLKEAEEEYEKAEGKDEEVFDKQRLENPYSDSRILHGDPQTEVNTVIVGVNIDTGEIVLTDRLREKGKNIDLIIGHHPRGLGLTKLHEVMHLQKDVLTDWGVPVTIADSLMEERIKEVERKIRGRNYNQSVDAAKLLDIPMICIHTPGDNLVEKFLSDKVEENEFETLGEVIDMLNDIPEYHEARKCGDGPTILVGNKDKRAGKVVVEMTGGTEGSKESYEKLADAGVGTIIGMHLSEEHRKKVEENHMNYVIAGHMASDSIGLNLFLDELEKKGIEIIPFSGFIRHSRN
ncbi:MAG: NGG1p interacting factor NIF3 [Thermoplasmatota archaeon]